MARASLDDEDAWEDDFQTLHMPVCYIVWWDGGGCGEPATERMEAPRRSPGWPHYQVDIGEEEKMLESIDTTWRATCWLQLAVQGIADDEVPWYELVIPLMSGIKGQAPPRGMELEPQGSRGGCLPTCPHCPQHQTIHDHGQSGRGCGGATLVCGLLPCTAADGQGSMWVEMGMASKGGT